MKLISISLVKSFLVTAFLAGANTVNAQELTILITQTAGGYYLPVNTRHSNSRYIGYGDTNSLVSSGACHLANDYSARVGTNVYAIADGYVERTSTTSGGYGGFRPRVNGGVMFIRHNMSEDGVMYGLYGHINNMTVGAGESVVAGQLLGTVGDFIDGQEITDPTTGKFTNGADISLPHLHFGLTSKLPTSTTSYDGYTATNACSDFLGYVDPEISMDRLTNRSTGYEWHGSGSLVKPSSTCFGCKKDNVILHNNGDKAFGVFQWKAENAVCEGIAIAASGKSPGSSVFNTPMNDLRVSITAGHWESRQLDKYYVAELPTKINVPEKNWNLVTVRMPVPIGDLSSQYTNVDLSKGIQLSATCLTDRRDAGIDISSKTLVSNTFADIEGSGASVWSGSGSLIQSQQTVFNKTIGISKDVSYMQTQKGNRKPYSTFQWQYGDSSCDDIRIKPLQADQSEYVTSIVTAQVKIRGWNQPPSAASTYNVTLPWTSSSFNTFQSNYYIASVKLIDSLPNDNLSLKIGVECR
jgi:hypothetical protein